MKRTFALQRLLLQRDRGTQWRLLVPFTEEEASAVMVAAAQLYSAVQAPAALRIVVDDHEQRPLMHWTRERGWK